MGSILSKVLGTDNDYQANAPIVPLTDFGNAINESRGNVQGLQGSQNALAQALLSRSSGQGPNPALDQLKQATNSNTQAATGMIAAQKGLNSGMATRMASQEASNANQQAAGQAATMSAEQQLGAQNQLSGLYNNMAAQNLNSQGINLQGNQAQNALTSANQNAASQINAKVSEQNAKTAGGIMGGILNAAGGALGLTAQPAGGVFKLSEGGMVPGTASVNGNSLVNDTVPAMLSPGEIVIPRTASTDPEKAKAFIDHIAKENYNHKPAHRHVVASQKALAERMALLETRLKAKKK